ncbi:MAG: leucine--tRNA ligase [Planctomycetaceae bacterium]|nr:leucine--tRNA ligase [Planctomycetaceae bacterium]
MRVVRAERVDERVVVEQTVAVEVHGITFADQFERRPVGAEVDFTIEGSGEPIRIFTTRPDTLFGVTFMSLAASHPLIEKIATPERKDEVARFAAKVKSESKGARGPEEAEKEGVFTGAYCINPLTGDRVPVYAANFVLMEYGTGAVMAVPAHDQRDFEFAQKYGIAIKPVIEPAKDADAETKQRYADFTANKAAFTDHGVMVNSGSFNGLSTEAGIKKIGETLAAKKLGGFVTNYRIRDWGLSRQRYWGCPIPVIHCACCGIVPVPENQLPVTLPEDIEFMPTGQSPLESHKPFTNVACPKCKSSARRETDTMDTFVDSSWYFVRYCDAKNTKSIADKAKVEHWMPVDQYIGGSEHAILHLIYARFINKVLRDIGISNCDEPFARMYTQGMICRESIMIPSENSRYISHEEFAEAQKQNKYTDDMLVRRVEKMSKSAKNGVDPTILVDKFGADTVRGYTLFMGPAEAESVWDDAGVIGVHKFIKRWWDAQQTWIGRLDGAKEGPCDGAAKELRRLSHLFIEKTEREYSGGFGFNTCIAKAMEFVNFLRDNAEKFGDSHGSRFAVKEALETLALCMAPITPHVSEELWAQLGHKTAVAQSPWPQHKPELTVQDEIEIAVQVNGKTRASMKVSKNASQAEMEQIAKSDPAVARHIEGKSVRKVILVPGRLLNIVVG